MVARKLVLVRTEQGWMFDLTESTSEGIGIFVTGLVNLGLLTKKDQRSPIVEWAVYPHDATWVSVVCLMMRTVRNVSSFLSASVEQADDARVVVQVRLPAALAARTTTLRGA